MPSIVRKANGWEARWRTPDNQSRRKLLPRKIDAERWLTKVQHDVLVGVYVDPSGGKVTVAEWWETWSQRQQWRDSSRASITSMFQRQVLPVLGKRPLNSLRRGDIDAFVAGLPVAQQYARQVTQYLATLLEAAVVEVSCLRTRRAALDVRRSTESRSYRSPQSRSARSSMLHRSGSGSR